MHGGLARIAWTRPGWTSSTSSNAPPPRIRRRPAADHRRRGHGQDQHARPPRRPPDRHRHRPRPHPAAHVHPPRGGGDDSARREHPRRARPQVASVGDLVAHLGRHVSRDGATGCCACTASRSGLGENVHRHRPLRRRRPAQRRAQRAAAATRARCGSRRRGRAWRSTAAASTRRSRSRTALRTHFPWCQDYPGAAQAAVPGVHRSASRSRTARLRRPAALLVPPDAGRGARRATCASGSTRCSSTSTRTPTRCRRRSSRGCARTAAG